MVNIIRWIGLVIGLAVLIGCITVTSAGNPIIVINSHSDGETVYTETITVSGGAMGTDGAGVESVTVNGVLTSDPTLWSAEISLQPGSNIITVVATDNFGNNATATITVIYYIEPPQPPEVMAYAPASPVTDVEGVARTFNLKLNQIVNVRWQINGIEVFSETDVSESRYTNTNAAVGTWNVSAVVSNSNGTKMQVWVWLVTTSQSTSTPTPTPTDKPPTSAPSPTSTPTVTPTGIISIDTIPSSAEVYLDESRTCTTPCSFDNISAGSYNLSIVKEGYFNETKAINLSAGETIIRIYQLKQLSGSINVLSIPLGASVFLNGLYEGETPWTISEVAEGSHSIKLIKSCYRDVTKSVSVSANNTTFVNETLKGYGSLDISSDPSGASVFLNGNYTGKTPKTLSEVDEGSHSIKLNKSGYKDVNRTVSVFICETTFVHEPLTSYATPVQISTEEIIYNMFEVSVAMGLAVFFERIAVSRGRAKNRKLFWIRLAIMSFSIYIIILIVKLYIL